MFKYEYLSGGFLGGQRSVPSTQEAQTGRRDGKWGQEVGAGTHSSVSMDIKTFLFSLT